MHPEDSKPNDIVDVRVEIPLPPLEQQVGLIVSTAMTNPEEAKRVLKLGIANAVVNGASEETGILLQVMWNLFGQAEYNQLYGELVMASITGDFSKFL
jgi:hypothetical protein